MSSIPTLIFLIAAAVLCGQAFGRNVVPPADAKPLTAVLESVAAAGYGAVTEVSFDDGRWEIEVLKEGRAVGLVVDPRTARVRTEYADEPHPALPNGALSCRDIVRKLNVAGYATIVKAEFEHGVWEVDAVSKTGERELTVDPAGKILNDRADD